MTKPLTWAVAIFMVAMSLFLGGMSYRVIFAKAITLDVDFRVEAPGTATAKINYKD